MLKLLMSPAGLKLDRYLVRWTGHSLLNRVFARQAGFQPRPALLLQTTGCRSGQRRSAALPYFDIAGRLFVVGSRGGMPQDPQWVNNLRRNPACQVYIRRRRYQKRARIAVGEEREDLWRQLVAAVPTYAAYQAKTTRQIPVVILEAPEVETS